MQYYVFSIILFWFSILFSREYAKQNIEYTDRSHEIMVEYLWDHEKEISNLRGEYEQADRNIRAELKQTNKHIYEKEISKAEKIIENWWYNPWQCSFDDIVDVYLYTKIIFHCSFSDSDSGYLSVNIESNTIVQHKNK
jgi:hypothetical protein